jgi:hypothetical protein
MSKLVYGLLALVLTSLGCSSQSETVKQRKATEEAISTRLDPSEGEPLENQFASELELDILISLWLHLNKEEERLRKMLHDPSLDEDKKTVINHFLVDIETQQRLTWQAAFNE